MKKINNVRKDKVKKPIYNVIQNLSYILKNYWKWDKVVFLIGLISIAVTMVQPLMPVLLSKYVVQMVVDRSELLSLLQMIIFLSVSVYLLNIINNTINNKMQYSALKNRYKYYMLCNSKIIDIDYELIESPEGQLKYEKAENSMYTQTAAIEVIFKNLTTLITNVFGLIAYSLIIFTLSPMLVLVLGASTILVYFLKKLDNKWVHSNKDKWINIERKLRYIENKASNFDQAKDIRLYSMKKWFLSLYKNMLGKRTVWYKKQEKRGGIIDTTSAIMTLLRDCVVYGFLIYKIYNNEISAPDFVLYFGVISQFSNWMIGIFDTFVLIDKGSLQICDLREFLEMKDVFNRGKGVEIPTTTSEIDLKNVSYYYHVNEKPVIDNINIKINKGEKIAIVGLNGAGKTTLVKLICGLYKPSSGTIVVGGHNIQEYNRDEYYKTISPVFQDIYLLPLSIAKNIALCNEEKIDYEKLNEVVKLSGLQEKINKLPDGLNTVLLKSVLENSVDLSGGEKQKLALARALYKEGKIIVLDEPTAALDPIAENEMYLKYNELTKDTTSIFISHRLSSTRFCDRIIFLENGKIVEIGTHDELMKLNGKYADLFEVQSHYYKEELNEAK